MEISNDEIDGDDPRDVFYVLGRLASVTRILTSEHEGSSSVFE